MRVRKKNAVLIMISATLENIVRLDMPEQYFDIQSWEHAIKYSRTTKRYSVPRDYSYIELYAFDSPNDISNLIRENERSGKWFIFWNDIKQKK